MDREYIISEINRVNKALKVTNSKHLKKDYSKYLKRLYIQLKQV